MKTTKRTLLTMVAAMLVIAMCFAMTACSGAKGSPEDVANAFMEATFEDFDAKAVFDLIHEDIRKVGFEKTDTDEDELIEEMQEGLDETKEEMEESDGSIEWEVDDVDDMSKDDIKKMNENLEKEDLDIEVTDGKTVTVTLTAFEDGEEAGSFDMPIQVIEIDGDWYLANMEQVNF